MTDSTIDRRSGDARFDVGSSADLFGEIESDGESGDDTRAETHGDESNVGDEQTAADVFDQLQTDIGDGDGTDDILVDESPDDIIASADEPDPEPDEVVDDDLLADDDELVDLLLTGRSKDGDSEFLWIDPDADDAGEAEPDSDTDGDDDALETDEPATNDTDDAVTASAPDAVDDTQAETALSTSDSVSDDTLEQKSDPNEETGEDELVDTNSSDGALEGEGIEPDTTAEDVEDDLVEADENEPVETDTDDDPALEPEDDTASESDADDPATEIDSERSNDSDGPLSKLRETLGGLL